MLPKKNTQAAMFCVNCTSTTKNTQDAQAQLKPLNFVVQQLHQVTQAIVKKNRVTRFIG